MATAGAKRASALCADATPCNPCNGAKAVPARGYVRLSNSPGLALDNPPAGAAASNATLVHLRYTNVLGVAPSPSTQDTYVDMLVSGTYDQADLVMMVGNTAENTAHIRLIGLAAKGLPTCWHV